MQISRDEGVALILFLSMPPADRRRGQRNDAMHRLRRDKNAEAFLNFLNISHFLSCKTTFFANFEFAVAPQADSAASGATFFQNFDFTVAPRADFAPSGATVFQNFDFTVALQVAKSHERDLNYV